MSVNLSGGVTPPLRLVLSVRRHVDVLTPSDTGWIEVWLQLLTSPPSPPSGLHGGDELLQ